MTIAPVQGVVTTDGLKYIEFQDDENFRELFNLTAVSSLCARPYVARGNLGNIWGGKLCQCSSEPLISALLHDRQDPWEIKNVIADPAYASDIQVRKKRLLRPTSGWGERKVGDVELKLAKGWK